MNNLFYPQGFIGMSPEDAFVDQICSILPVTEWCFEVNKFAFMAMEDGTVKGTDFQNGRMKDYKSVEEYVIARQGGRCACCGKPIDDIHHIELPNYEDALIRCLKKDNQ